MTLPQPAARIRTVIADDEAVARRTLRMLLAAHADFELVGSASNGDEAVTRVIESEPDVLFLDVRMPGLDGFEVIERLAGRVLPLVVFVTAYDRYAIRAFEEHAVDYLLKPFDDLRFEAALDRLREALRHRKLADLESKLMELLGSPELGRGSPPEAGRRRLAVRASGRVLYLPTDEIDWLEAVDYYVRLHVGGRTHLLRRSLRELEGELAPDRFVRVHRSRIVNLARVAELHPHRKGDGFLVLEDGTRLRMSRRYRANVEARLGA